MHCLQAVHARLHKALQRLCKRVTRRTSGAPGAGPVSSTAVLETLGTHHCSDACAATNVAHCTACKQCNARLHRALQCLCKRVTARTLGASGAGTQPGTRSAERVRRRDESKTFVAGRTRRCGSPSRNAAVHCVHCGKARTLCASVVALWQRFWPTGKTVCQSAVKSRCQSAPKNAAAFFGNGARGRAFLCL